MNFHFSYASLLLCTYKDYLKECYIKHLVKRQHVGTCLKIFYNVGDVCRNNFLLKIG